ncbi:hypothetical protein [Agrococcus casei]|uniref:hypothetical protein n=1 Tax=Agrococcus casei TaxID=343512 RepID=UPI003F9086B1
MHDIYESTEPPRGHKGAKVYETVLFCMSAIEDGGVQLPPEETPAEAKQAFYELMIDELARYSVEEREAFTTHVEEQQITRFDPVMQVAASAAAELNAGAWSTELSAISEDARHQFLEQLTSVAGEVLTLPMLLAPIVATPGERERLGERALRSWLEKLPCDRPSALAKHLDWACSTEPLPGRRKSPWPVVRKLASEVATAEVA